MVEEQTPSSGDSELLRRFLADHSAPCPNCGYELRALTADTCPECGEAIRLGVLLARPRLGMFIAGLVGLSAGLGFNFFVLMWFAYARLMMNVGSAISVREAVPPICCGVVLGGALIPWIRFHARLRAASPVTRALLVSACWIASAASAVWFFWWVV